MLRRHLWFIFFWLSLGAFSFFPSCSDTSPGATCSVDTDCSDGLICSEGTCKAAECQDSSACKDGKICKDKRCVPCQSKEDCGKDKVCSSGQCVPTCKEDKDCKEGEVCEEEKCILACKEDKDCADGKLCQEGHCTEGCAEDKDCQEGQICENKKCVEAICSKEKACPEGQICDAGRCRACQKSDECGQGKICSNGACTEGCEEDADCQNGQKCKKSIQKCVECLKNEDCSDGKVCRENACSACLADKECAQGELCLEGKCEAGDCRRNEDCKDNKICLSHKCSPCAEDKQCEVGQICEQGKCQAGCREDKQCRSGQVCDQKQKICTGCLKNEDCKAGQVCLKNTCTQCTDDASCGQGKLCLNGLCKEGDCRDSKECQDGKICFANKCSPCSVDKQCAKDFICLKGSCIKGNCKTYMDCQAGQVCLKNVCSACTDDKQCLAGQLCLSGKCVLANCRQNSDCKGGLICEKNRCSTCSKDTQCDQGSLCVHGVCVKGDCRQNADCQGGKICKNNQCSNCTDDKECASGYLCLKGSCTQGNCRKNADCKGGLVCEKNRCSNCSKDTQCDKGSLCVHGVCLKGDCHQNADCKGGKICKNNKCSACLNDRECPVNSICEKGVCLKGDCHQNADCHDGKICKNNKCSACANNAECGSGKVCDKGACKVGDCVANADCKDGKLCKNNKCSACANNAECGSGKVCDKGACKVGDCVANADCKDGKICKNNKCSACANNAECGSGKVCDKGACKVGDCVANADCKDGKICKNNKCSACANDSDCGAGGICKKGACWHGILLDNGAYRWNDKTYEADCLGYRYPKANYAPALKDGLYWIKPDPKKAAFKVACDMTTNGGGWTRCLLQVMDGKTFYRRSVGRDVSNVRNDKPLPPLSWIAQQCSGPAGEQFLIRGKRLGKLSFLIRGTTQAKMFDNSKGYTCYDVVDLANNNIVRRLAVIRNGGYYGRVCGFAGGRSINSLWMNRPSGITERAHIEYSYHGSDAYRRIGTFNNNERVTKSIEIYRRAASHRKSLVVVNGARRYQDGTAATSCSAYRFGPFGSSKMVSGAYWIQPDKSAQPFKVLCDMTTDGGGWTLIAKYSTKLKLADFRYARHQQQNSSHGQTLKTPPDLTNSNIYGHVAYNTFPIRNRKLRLECSTDNKKWYSVTYNNIFKEWRVGDHNTYGNSSGWGIIGEHATHQRAYHYICGSRIQSAHNYWYTGIAYCKGRGGSGSWGNHLVSFSFTKPTGNLAMGCNRRGISGYGRVWVRDIAAPHPVVLAGGAYRWQDGSVARNCTEYRYPKAGSGHTSSLINGFYWIKPDPSLSPVKAYCEMSIDGGGWTVVAMAFNENYDKKPQPIGNGKAGTWNQWAEHFWESNNSYYLSLKIFDLLTHKNTVLRQLNRDNNGKIIKMLEYSSYDYNYLTNKSSVGTCRNIVSSPCSGSYTWKKRPPNFNGWGKYSGYCNSRYPNSIWNYHNDSHCASDSGLFAWCGCSTPRPALLGSYRNTAYEQIIMVRDKTLLP